MAVHPTIYQAVPDAVKSVLRLALIAALAFSTGGCGRDNNQEKVGAAASKKNSDAPAASSKGPLQTGEVDPSKAAEMPSGTQTGGRTTPNPK